MKWKLQRIYLYLATAVIFLILTAFLIVPILLTVKGGFTDGQTGKITAKYFIGEGYGVFRDPLYMRGLFNAIKIASATTLICLAATLPMAMIAARYDFRGKAVITSLLLVPLILPPFVGAIGLQSLLGRFGALNSALMWLGLLQPDQPGIDFLGGAVGGRFLAVVLLEVLHLYPILYLNLVAAFANLDPSLGEAARMLGASRVKRFFRCTLPLVSPGIFAGSTLVFIWSFTELGTPLMLEFKEVTPVQVFYGLTDIQSNQKPYALVVVMLLVAAFLYACGRLAVNSPAAADSNRASIAAAPQQLKGWRAILVPISFLAIVAAAVLPHLGVILNSFSASGGWYRSVLPSSWTGQHFAEALGHELAMRSILNSLLYAGVSVILCSGLGVAVAYLTVRIRIRGGAVLDTLAMMPLAVPGLVMAFGYLALTLWLERTLGDTFLAPAARWFSVQGENPQPIVLLVIAYAIRRLPYIVRSASAGLEQTSGSLEEASRNLGAGWATTIRRIVLPLILANLIAGAILVFSFAMLEVSDSLILAEQEQHYPITKAIWTLFNRLGDGPYIASAMGVWAMALLATTLIAASVIMGRRVGAMFRI